MIGCAEIDDLLVVAKGLRDMLLRGNQPTMADCDTLTFVIDKVEGDLADGADDVSDDLLSYIEQAGVTIQEAGVRLGVAPRIVTLLLDGRISANKTLRILLERLITDLEVSE